MRTTLASGGTGVVVGGGVLVGVGDSGVLVLVEVGGVFVGSGMFV
jgi:hypothetical protein